MITQEKLEKEKLSLHLKYISGISFGCICLVVILSFCESTMFQNCISVASTVTSIILSVVAIILSVTGERATNEIRNKVSDSVNQLEDCTEKSSELTEKSSELNEDLTRTLQQLKQLCEDMNNNVIDKLPNIQSDLSYLVSLNEESKSDKIDDRNKVDVVEHIVRFLDNINKDTKYYVKEMYSFMMEEGKKNSVSVDEINQYLMSKGASSITATLVIGIVLGNLCTGTISDKVEELIKRL